MSYSSKWEDPKYVIGSNATMYYNLCPLQPINQDDVDVCNKHGVMDPFVLSLSCEI